MPGERDDLQAWWRCNTSAAIRLELRLVAARSTTVGSGSEVGPDGAAYAGALLDRAFLSEYCCNRPMRVFGRHVDPRTRRIAKVGSMPPEREEG